MKGVNSTMQNCNNFCKCHKVTLGTIIIINNMNMKNIAGLSEWLRKYNKNEDSPVLPVEPYSPKHLDNGQQLLLYEYLMCSHCLKNTSLAGCWLLTPVILASQETEIRKITVHSQPQANSLQSPILRKPK
jgi:hypothetical protein